MTLLFFATQTSFNPTRWTTTTKNTEICEFHFLFLIASRVSIKKPFTLGAKNHNHFLFLICSRVSIKKPFTPGTKNRKKRRVLLQGDRGRRWCCLQC